MATLVQTPLQSGDETIALRFDFVFHVENLAPLATLLALQRLLGRQQLIFRPLVESLSLSLEVGVVLFQRFGQRCIDLSSDIDFEIDRQHVSVGKRTAHPPSQLKHSPASVGIEPRPIVGLATEHQMFLQLKALQLQQVQLQPAGLAGQLIKHQQSLRRRGEIEYNFRWR